MKKLILSSFVVVSFILYSLNQKNNPAQATLAPTVLPTVSNLPSTTTSPGSGPTPTPGNPGSRFKDGQYTGSVADAFYGNVQVKAVIQGGQLTDVQFLQYPSDRRESLLRSQYSIPILTREAIQAQTAQVDVVSGATQTSQAFIESLTSALSQAQ